MNILFPAESTYLNIVLEYQVVLLLFVISFEP